MKPGTANFCRSVGLQKARLLSARSCDGVLVTIIVIDIEAEEEKPNRTAIVVIGAGENEIYRMRSFGIKKWKEKKGDRVIVVARERGI